MQQTLEYISINHRVNKQFVQDPLLGPAEFKPDPELDKTAVDSQWRDLMIPWYRGDTNGTR